MKGYHRNRTIQSLDKLTLDRGLQEQGFHLPPPWHVFSSLQVADAIGVSLQTMHNMRLRRSGPRSEPFEDYLGNRIMYRLDHLYKWITGHPVWLFHQEWLSRMHPSLPSETEEDCGKTSKYLIDLNLYPQPKWKRKRKAGPIKALGGA